jgi:hypothetical protein
MCSTAFARSADQGGRHLQLIEGLVPDVIEPIGLRHARPDTGIDEVEEKQSGDALRRFSRHRLHEGAPDIMADDADLLEVERVEQRHHIRGMLIGTERPIGFVDLYRQFPETRQPRRRFCTLPRQP